MKLPVLSQVELSEFKDSTGTGLMHMVANRLEEYLDLPFQCNFDISILHHKRPSTTLKCSQNLPYEQY